MCLQARHASPVPAHPAASPPGGSSSPAIRPKWSAASRDRAPESTREPGKPLASSTLLLRTAVEPLARSGPDLRRALCPMAQ